LQVRLAYPLQITTERRCCFMRKWKNRNHITISKIVSSAFALQLWVSFSIADLPSYTRTQNHIYDVTIQSDLYCYTDGTHYISEVNQLRLSMEITYKGHRLVRYQDLRILEKIEDVGVWMVPNSPHENRKTASSEVAPSLKTEQLNPNDFELKVYMRDKSKPIDVRRGIASVRQDPNSDQINIVFGSEKSILSQACLDRATVLELKRAD
jgi:hypothetical protein